MTAKVGSPQAGMAWRITGIYAAVGFSWIVLSSAAIWISVGEPPGVAAFLEMTKGLAFIAVTALLLLFLLRRWETELVRRDRALAAANLELSEVNERLSGLMRASPDLIAAWDRDKRLTAFNPRFQAVCWNYFGVDVRPGMAVEEIFAVDAERCAHFSQCWDRTLGGEAFVLLQSLEQEGEVAWFETSYGAISGPRGRIDGGFHIVRDVTERIRAEGQRRAYAEGLERAVSSLTEANSELERFAFVASHDLQEPLRTITCFAQLVKRDYAPVLDQRGREHLELVSDAAIRMHDLINDLLAYSRSGVNEGATTMISADAACRSALDNLREAITAARAEIIIPAPLPAVVADSIHLVQVFQNLIGNAVKYRSPDTPPRVEIRAERRNALWEFSVADNGIGFNPSEQDVFELFRRLHPHSGYAGTGVGLAICKRLTTRMGGRIWVESRPGAGSTFRFTIPAERPSP